MPDRLPLMVYLSGIGGTGLGASSQFRHLVQRFDLRAMFTPVSDRTTFKQQVELIRWVMEECGWWWWERGEAVSCFCVPCTKPAHSRSPLCTLALAERAWYFPSLNPY